MLKQANEEYEKKTLALEKGLDLETLVGAVAKHFSIDPDIVKSSSKQRAVCRARSIICYLATEKLMISGADLVRKLRLSPSAVGKLAARGRMDSLGKRIESDIFDFKLLPKNKKATRVWVAYAWDLVRFAHKLLFVNCYSNNE